MKLAFLFLSSLFSLNLSQGDFKREVADDDLLYGSERRSLASMDFADDDFFVPELTMNSLGFTDDVEFLPNDPQLDLGGPACIPATRGCERIPSRPVYWYHQDTDKGKTYTSNEMTHDVVRVFGYEKGPFGFVASNLRGHRQHGPPA